MVKVWEVELFIVYLSSEYFNYVKYLLIFLTILIYVFSTGRNERTVVMDKSKGEPVISVKTKSKERVSQWTFFLTSAYTQLVCASWGLLICFLSFFQSTKSRDRKSLSKEKKDILSFDQIKEQRERERQRQREREIREVERRRYT